jgi:Reverse transcriptase (RNA-dependent DNA polymerase)
MNIDGNMTTYKTRLVVKRYSQVRGINYDENFLPVTMFRSIRILLVIVVFYGYEIWQMNVKITFLNKNLKENVYMVQPSGFEDPNNDSKICKFQKFIYGLKQ